MEAIYASCHKLRQAIREKKVSVKEVVKSHFDRIKQVEQKVKAFVTLLESDALRQADEIDKKIAKGEVVGALAGIPIAIKDNICAKGVRTTCSSKILEEFVAPYDAFVINRLRQADAIIIGKTNLDEFAMGSSTENSAFFTTHNPWDLDRVPGGSSGGSAAAVAAGEVCIALGSDTGGSIRQPASLCGIVGYKPTYGIVSRYGLVAFASSLDQIGPMTRCVEDAALLAGVIAGKDENDSTSVAHKIDFSLNGAKINGLKIGVPKEYFGEGLDSEVRKAIEASLKTFQKLGAELVDVSLKISEYGIATYYMVAPSEASSNLARYDGVHYGFRDNATDDIISMMSKTRENGFGAEVKRRIMLGTFALSSGYYDAYYLRALKVRRLIKEDFDKAFEKADVIVGPTSPIPAFKIGDKVSDPMAMYLCDIFTVSTNLAGLPAISIPCSFTKSGLPVGLQIHGRAFDDAKILQVANAFEKEAGLVDKHPKL